MIKDTIRLFLHSVDRDIEYLEGIGASKIILKLLSEMQDTVRSSWALMISNDKNQIGNPLHDYLELNVLVNRVYNAIVQSHNDDIGDSGADDVTEYIINELFLSYTIFLDAYSELGFYYVICEEYPFHNAIFFAQQKHLRQANRLRDDMENGEK